MGSETRALPPNLRHLVLPLGLILIVSVVAIAGLAFFAARSQDRLAIDGSRHLMRSVLAAEFRDIAKLALDNSYWDEAVAKLVYEPDAEWADDNIGSYLVDAHGLEGSYVLDGSNRSSYGQRAGERDTSDPLQFMAGGLDRLIDRARQGTKDEAPIPQTGLVTVGDTVHLVAVSVFTDYGTKDGEEYDKSTDSVLILCKALKGDLLAALGRDFGLYGLKFERDPAHLGLAALALSAADGTALGSLAWRVVSPGQQMLSWLMPGIAVTFLVLAGLGYLLLWRSQSLLSAYIMETEEREKAEATVRQYQKLESLSTLAGGLAHNFNNLLVPILALGSRVLRETPESSPNRAALEQIIRAAERARDLVRLVRSFGRQSEALLDTIDLSECIGETVELLRAGVPPEITVKDRIDADTGRMVADPAQIATIVMNLTSNALDAIAEVADRKGGEVTIALDRVEVDKDAAAANPDLVVGPHARLEITDNGTGMAPAVREQAFDPFFTTKEPDRGTGLGLSTTHGIVSRHGGSIRAHTEPGRGSSFEVFLPLAESATATAA